MTARIVALGHVDSDGMLRFDDVTHWAGGLRSFLGKRVRVTISRETKGRTLPQNQWLWGAIYPAIADWSGHSVDEIHEVMKQMHGSKRLVQLPGGNPRQGDTAAYNVAVPRSTATYTTDEFSEYVERVRAWAAQQGLNIPDPGRCA